jgi:hypothetical protein
MQIIWNGPPFPGRDTCQINQDFEIKKKKHIKSLGVSNLFQPKERKIIRLGKLAIATGKSMQ